MLPIILSEQNFEYLAIGWNTHIFQVRSQHNITKGKKEWDFFFLSYQSLKNIVRIMFRARDIFQD